MSLRSKKLSQAMQRALLLNRKEKNDLQNTVTKLSQERIDLDIEVTKLSQSLTKRTSKSSTVKDDDNQKSKKKRFLFRQKKTLPDSDIYNGEFDQTSFRFDERKKSSVVKLPKIPPSLSCDAIRRITESDNISSSEDMRRPHSSASLILLPRQDMMNSPRSPRGRLCRMGSHSDDNISIKSKTLPYVSCGNLLIDRKISVSAHKLVDKKDRWSACEKQSPCCRDETTSRRHIEVTRNLALDKRISKKQSLSRTRSNSLPDLASMMDEAKDCRYLRMSCANGARL